MRSNLKLRTEGVYSRTSIKWFYQTAVLQHLKPPYAPFPENFVDSIQPYPRANSEYSFVLEWLESVGSDRNIQCQSDSHLELADDSPILRWLVSSAPAIGFTPAADGFAVPSTPASTGGSIAPSNIIGSSGLSGRKPPLPGMNLAASSIYIRPLHEQFPEHITDTNIVRCRKRDRDSPGPSLEDGGRTGY